MTRTAFTTMPLGFQDPGMGVDQGMPAEFQGFFVLFVILGIGTLVWRISLARRVAEQSGMDPDRATEMVLLSDDGLDATYLASNLRPAPSAAVAPSAQEDRSAEDRLREIQELHDQGLLTGEEYQARRKAIVDSL